MFYLVVVLSIGFGLLNGLHDAGNAIAAPLATRALRPGTALALASAFHLIGALVVGTAVAGTVAGIVEAPARTLTVVAAAVTGALAWNAFTLWRGLPCSSGHCLVGALGGAAAAAGGWRAVHWGGLHGLRPVGVVGSLIWLLGSTVVAAPAAALLERSGRRALRRAKRAVARDVRRAEVASTAALAFAHGANDAQKTMGLLAFALVAGGRLAHFAVPYWVVVVSALSLTTGTSMGGWRVVRTLGWRIYRIGPLQGLASQTAAAAVVLAASLAGAPVSTTDVVAPAVVGVGAAERWRHVRWLVIGEIGLAWLVTLPAAAALGALTFPIWRWVS